MTMKSNTKMSPWLMLTLFVAIGFACGWF